MAILKEYPSTPSANRRCFVVSYQPAKSSRLEQLHTLARRPGKACAPGDDDKALTMWNALALTAFRSGHYSTRNIRHSYAHWRLHLG
jgi:uncharacterized protein YyaL (SSP411 family)